MRAIRFTATALAMSAMLDGCTTRVADLTVASSKNVNMNSGQFSEGRRVSGSDSIPVIIIPLGQPNIKEAIDRAIEKDQCAVGLSNVVIDQEFFAFLFGMVQFTAEGNLIIDNGKPGCGGYVQTRSAPPQAYAQPTYAPSKEQQIQQLQQRNLPYDQYQQEYRRIMGN
ncbi:hypothetical protein H681_23140 [Pseudomonas sp. ATCC 13867]|uniref:hypothetical protein n=1 Tax=Pseudomonas sp. ATCC 13867 TaxID=1294143 RepID=UPI0002C4F736|nr:hypothetical protein [Pseudomonas sp. ATCC 13867]AGI26495.1 hypothetical protein H681_23140 [Pseudomonas sp. ATCC 13867]RFQ21416.1 hypothetical protein D0N87_24100 [Pseudomonas sp. ATCC 13867]